MGIDWIDAIMAARRHRLEEVVARHPHVLGTLVGHFHTACASTFAGRPLLIGGGVSSVVPLAAEGRPRIWEDAPPSFAVHLVTDDLRLITHWRSLPEVDG